MAEDRSDCRETRRVDAAPPEAPLIGKLLDGRYLLHECLGEGGMGSVYRGTHVMMDKPVAVKVINDELAHIPEVAKRFEREARAASRLTDPHCITVTDFGRTEDGMLYLVMELLKGEELADRLKKKGALPVDKALDLTRQILKGLVHAHAAGVIHRDLKPENVMLVAHGDETEFAKVFDFGIAKLASGAGAQENLTQTGIVMGTPSYLSPEQALGEEADHRADIYAVGIMLFEMLAGVGPFTGESAMDLVTAHLTAPIPSLPEPSRFPEGLQEIIERAAAKRPADRYGSAAEFLQALEAIDADVSSATAKPAGFVFRKLKRFDLKNARKARMLGAGAVLAITAVVIALVVGTEDEPVKAKERMREGLPGEAATVAVETPMVAEKEAAVEQVESLTADFNKFTSCKMRRKIIADMERTKNPEFLPLLRSALSAAQKETPKRKSLVGQIKEQFRKSKSRDKEQSMKCIEDDLKRAIRALTAIEEAG